MKLTAWIAAFRALAAVTLGAFCGWIGAALVWNFIYGIGGRVISDEIYETWADEVYQAGLWFGAGSAGVLAAFWRRGLLAAICAQHFLAVAAGGVGGSFGWRPGLIVYFGAQAFVLLVLATWAAGTRWRAVRLRRQSLVSAAVLLLALSGPSCSRKPWLSWSGLFYDPEGLAIDAAGNLYVADEDPGRLTVLDPAGKPIARGPEFLPGTEERVTRGDSLVVLEPGRVMLIGRHKLTEVDGLLGGAPRVARTFGERGSGPGQIEDAEGIARDANGDFYFTDEDNRRIAVFDRDGKFVKAWPVADDPEGICIVKDQVIVTFSKASWIGFFTRDGELKSRFGKPGSGPGEFHVPDFICLSPRGELYVTDQGNNRIQVFDLGGKYLFSFGGRGSEPGRFDEPEDLVFLPDGNLVVADGGNHRLQVLTPDGKPLRIIE